jgi:hypothetical protein
MWEKEERLYHKLYITFNDDNEHHYESSFISNGLSDASSEKLHKQNLDLISHIIERGGSEKVIEELKECAPEVEPYLMELNII